MFLKIDGLPIYEPAKAKVSGTLNTYFLVLFDV